MFSEFDFHTGYTAVAGLGLTSIKDRLLKLPPSSTSTRARNFAVKRGSGVAIWLVCILACLEILCFELGLTLGSIFAFSEEHRKDHAVPAIPFSNAALDFWAEHAERATPPSWAASLGVFRRGWLDLPRAWPTP